MLGEVFYWVFNMSITASVTGLLILLIRRIRKLPRRLSVFLWLVPFLRMVIPFGLNSPYSLMSLLSRVTTKTVTVYQGAPGFAFSATNSIMAANSYFPITYKTNSLETIFAVASVLWIVVSLAILLMLAVTYFTTMHEIKDAQHLTGNIYLSGKVLSPAVYGIVKPKIVLPMCYRERDTAMIVLHEKTHIRSLDNLWRMIAFGIVAVHWFNPLCWLFLKELLGDMELACDERVLSKLGAEHAREYAASLLDSKQGTTVFASAFGGAKIRTRIENILSFRKLSWFSLTVFLILIGAIFYVLLTNAG